MIKTIDSFRGEYRFLSNFWPVEVVYDGETYSTVEHAYQASKTTDTIARIHIQLAETPGKAKRYGKNIPLRINWFEIRVDIMEKLILQKFTNDLELQHKLLATYPAYLVEGNHWGDTFWGVCDGHGRNHLGTILMETRMKLRDFVR